MEFVSLAMLIIDDIFYPVPRVPSFNVLGGAGSYAALGARLICGAEHARAVSWIIHEGSDFPETVKEQIQSWNTSCEVISTPHRLTTRAMNVYRQNEIRGMSCRRKFLADTNERDFEYTSPKIRLDESTLTQQQLMARCYHLVCSPMRCIDLVKGIITKREELLKDSGGSSITYDRPVFVWEPLPALCIPEEFENFMSALKYVDVVSPNLEEFGGLLGESSAPYDMDRCLAYMCGTALDSGSTHNLACLVVRMGKEGCLIADKDATTQLPAFHQTYPLHPLDGGAIGSSEIVVDPTGAGHAFLGGFCFGLKVAVPSELNSLANHVDAQLLVAAVCGSIAASFALEQVGPPILSRTSSHDKHELWNNASVERRFEQMIKGAVRWKGMKGANRHIKKYGCISR